MPKPRKAQQRNTSAGPEFNHAMVYVRELGPALKFYADHLGFKVIEIYETAYARLQSPKGGMTIALHVVAPGQPLSSEASREVSHYAGRPFLRSETKRRIRPAPFELTRER